MSDPIFNRISVCERRIVREHIAAAPVRLARLADALGLKVLRAKLPQGISGLIQPVNKDIAPAGFQIKVNKFENPKRQRFTVAHEIAHYLLHRDQIKSTVYDNILYRSSLSNKLEAEANRLAAQIIMPAALLESDLGQLDRPPNIDDLYELSDKYNVSREAMRIKIGM